MALDRDDIYHRLANPRLLDYGLYLQVDRLLSCQKDFADLANGEELQFQIVHQVEELWMKLIAYTLVDADQAMRDRQAMKALTLFDRVHRLMRLLNSNMELLETMSPRDYQEVRLKLGNGSGQESPGFALLLSMSKGLWDSYDATYVTGAGRTIADIYDTGFAHDEAYKIGEALLEYDELFQKFRSDHIYLIHRSIGMGSQSLKGRSVDLLNQAARHRFFPELWDIRWQMTDRWGATYGRKRDSLAASADAADEPGGHASPTGEPLAPDGMPVSETREGPTPA